MTLVSGLSKGQVLQRLGARGASAALQGTVTGSGPAPVRATIRGARGVLEGWKGRIVGTAARGKFAARLDGIPAGGPYRLELSVGNDTLQLREFFVGDVWLLAGQSNMAGCGAIFGAARSHPLVRAFSQRREWRAAAEPLHVPEESPDACHAARQCTPARGETLRRAARRGTGPGLFFAREMLARSGVPQGLICAAHGGTSMRQWDPARKGDGGGSLYGSLLCSVRATGQPVAGLLWYQGESDANADDAPLYTKRMRKLVSSSRRDLGQPGLPWITVQIARVFGRNGEKEAAAWNRIQEQQRLLPDAIPGLETVAAVDLPLDDPIHIGAAGFPLLARRLARAADRLVHRNRREPPAPRLKSVRGPVPDPASQSLVLSVRFSHVPGGLRSAGPPGGFALVDGEGRDTRAIFKTTLHGDTARLHFRAASSAAGLSLHYGHGPAPSCTVTDGRGMALPAFGPLPLGKWRAGTANSRGAA